MSTAEALSCSTDTRAVNEPFKVLGCSGSPSSNCDLRGPSLPAPTDTDPLLPGPAVLVQDVLEDV